MPGGGTIQIRRPGSRFYDKAHVYNYAFGGEFDFTGSAVYYIQPMKGAQQGQVYDIQVSSTLLFTNDSTGALIRVGTNADTDKYAELDMQTTAASIVWGSYDYDIFGSSRDGFIDMVRDGTAGVALNFVEVGYVSPTGGTPAGKGWVTITIGWW